MYIKCMNCTQAFAHLGIYRYGPVVMKSVTTVTGDGSLLRLSADACLSRSSAMSRLKPPPTLLPPIKAVLEVDVESMGDTSWYVLCAADNNLGVE